MRVRRCYRIIAGIFASIMVMGSLTSVQNVTARQHKERQVEGERPSTETDGDESNQDSMEVTTEETTEESTEIGGIMEAVSSLHIEEDTEEEEEDPVKLPHGTTNTVITEEMLYNTPPSDYQVNQDMQAEAQEGKYNEYFLEDDLQTIQIDIDENNLNYLWQNAGDKPTVMTNSVTIGDQVIGYTGMKTKGSYTLDHSVSDNKGSDRFSFTINFGKYIKKKDYGAKQNFYGVSKISFNNFFFDKSMMKEFFALKLLSEMGVPTPQYGLAKVYINGDYYGVYSMIEALDSSILEQYYQVDDDEISNYLLKPEGTNFIYSELEKDPSPLWEKDEESYQEVKDMIPTVMMSIKRLNQLSEGKNFEDQEIDVNSQEYLDLLGQVIDVDEMVKYFAVHSFLCQMDNMFVGQKNFGLYCDKNGIMQMIPWDYDLSFGCYYPFESEATSNFNLDVMFRLGGFYDNSNEDDLAEIKEQCEMMYQFTPMFHVIYQNDSLMEQMHQYMRDCSKVAALGGTIYSGNTYEPAYFYSYIEKMKDRIYDAASEKMADNAKYMNRINQPQDCRTAFSNLGKIIAMRSVGVLSQTDKLGTRVCGNGCNLGTLGNAMEGWYADNGTLSCVDAATGMFTTAEYAGSGSPAITVKKLRQSDEMYERIRQSIGCEADDSLVIYKIKDTAEALGDYTVTVPLQTAYEKAGGEIAFYSYGDGEATKLELSNVEHLYSAKMKKLKYLAICQKGGNALGENAGDGAGAGFHPLLLCRMMAAVGVLVAVSFAVIVIMRRRRKAAVKMHCGEKGE